jgi:hypothetical protein
VTYARPIRWAALAVAVGSLALIPRASFDHNPVNLRDPSTESVQAFQDLLQQSSTSPWTVDLVERLATAQRRPRSWRSCRSSSARSRWSTTCRPPAEKRAILDTMAFLRRRGPRSAAPDAAAQIAALARLEAALAAGERRRRRASDASERACATRSAALRAAPAAAPQPRARSPADQRRRLARRAA